MTVTPGSAPQRFPGYDVTDQSHTWDEVTRNAVLGRLRLPAAMQFFSAEEEPTARALVDRLLAQDGEPRVPALELIDAKLAARRGDGYRYRDMPEDWEAWPRSVAGLDSDARRVSGRPFWDLSRQEQKDGIEHVRGMDGDWYGMPSPRIFSLWLRYACEAFYSHPWAWNEIGFGGPAYPRGYKNLGIGRREPWEVAEVVDADPVPWVERAEAARRRHQPEPAPPEDQPSAAGQPADDHRR
ncbi:MAG TPA: gluconate 2-dehydrogenase subunit 3 family protein [Acidimicrobiales bacterium]|nr:gluconate 2-dehydrogenase subunit 3 family protein [Acidimicrobiales bacterium]